MTNRCQNYAQRHRWNTIYLLLNQKSRSASRAHRRLLNGLLLKLLTGTEIYSKFSKSRYENISCYLLTRSPFNITFDGENVRQSERKDVCDIFICRYRCGVCQSPFVSRELAIAHLRSAHPVMPYQCPYCKKRFTTQYTFTHHIRTEHPDEPEK